MSTRREQHDRREGAHHARRSAFTLVELLVSAGLIVLMMFLFAQVFQLATGVLGTQRGIAENDQRARTLTTVLLNDLGSRTFRTVIPYVPGEPADTARRGYLYVSENDDDDREDVLAFTVQVDQSAPPYFGRAEHLFYEDSDGNGQFDSGEPIYLNQPELDSDGDPHNEMARSTAAEICYFLRAGNLYRRVLLIRPRSGAQTQPSTADGTELFDPTLPPPGAQSPLPYDHEFYEEFDYSVYPVGQMGNLRLQFHGFDSLTNAGGGGSSFFSLGNPQYRFGHNYLTGQPREYVRGPNGPDTAFIGRFTHEETSHPTFTFPFDLNNGNPFERRTNQPTFIDLDDNNQDGVVNQYLGGLRRSEDIMMTHVHGFDVKLWDDQAGGFRDVGWQDDPTATPPVTGDLGASSNRHRSPFPNFNPPFPPIVYGPRGQANAAQNRVFDTWHPAVDINQQQNDPRLDGYDLPPYRPMRPGVDGEPGFAMVDDDNQNGVDDAGELGWPGSDDEPIPVRALQIKIRYYDVASDQNRVLTLEASLLD